MNEELRDLLIRVANTIKHALIDPEDSHRHNQAAPPRVTPDGALLGLEIGDTVFYWLEDDGKIESEVVCWIDLFGVAYFAYDPKPEWQQPFLCPVTAAYSTTPQQAAQADAQEIKAEVRFYEEKLKNVRASEALIDD